MEEIRLNKYLSEMGICSRREADRLIEAGKVLVDGVPAAMGSKVTKAQKVVCNGKQVGGANAKKVKHVLLVVNKPRGIVCTTSDKDRAVNIVDFLHYPSRVYPVGRLDKDSEGLILMTNQGDLVNKMMRAGNAHEKEYVVKVDKPFNQKFLDAMAAGVEITTDDKKVTTLPCEMKALSKDTFQITLTQGLNRQIRRMCEAFGYHVMTLKRTRIMNIRLGNLKTGDCRRVSPAEYQELLDMIEDSTNLSYEESMDED